MGEGRVTNGKKDHVVYVPSLPYASIGYGAAITAGFFRMYGDVFLVANGNGSQRCKKRTVLKMQAYSVATPLRCTP